MELSIAVMDGININEDDLNELSKLLEDKEKKKVLMYCNIININNRAIKIYEKVYSVNDNSFYIVLGDYVERHNFIL